MGLNMLLYFNNSGLIDTFVSTTVTIRVFALQKYLIIKSGLFILFLSNKFQTD